MKNWMFIFLPACLAISCSSVQMVPHSYSTERPTEVIAVVSDPSVEIYMEHLSRESEQLVFDLQVVNTGEDMIRVDPHKVRIYGAYEKFPDPDADSLLHAQAVLHSPGHGHQAMSEQQVNAYFKRKIRAKQAAQVAILLVGVALAVNDAVNDVQDSRQEFWTAGDQVRSDRRDALTFTGLMAADLVGGALENEKFKTMEDLKYLPEEYHQEELVFPDGSSRGKVFFNVPSSFNYYRIIVPVGGISYIFDFRKANAVERRILRQLKAY